MDRICNEALLRKVTTPRAAAAHIKNGMTVGFSGFTVIGYPKVLPAELARRAEEGEELGITVITGGNVGDQLDGYNCISYTLHMYTAGISKSSSSVFDHFQTG